MKTMNRNILLAATGVIAILAAAFAWQWYTAEQAPDAAGPAAGSAPWTWKNPITQKTATLPPDWKVAEGKSIQGAVLTLTHWTGKGLIYLVHEETMENVTLQEFVEARQDSIKKELGIERLDKSGEEQDSYTGEGAKLFGKAVVETRVRIWRPAPHKFWRASMIIDSEYKKLKYDAGKIVDLLKGTTL